MLFYWYDPQYLNATYKLVAGAAAAALQGLPGRREAGRRPEKYACAYPTYVLDEVHQQEVRDERLARRQVREEAGSWTNADQNVVAGLIAGKHMDPDKAAEQWIAKNQAKVNKWLGK